MVEVQGAHRARVAATMDVNDYVAAVAGVRVPKGMLSATPTQAEVHWYISNETQRQALPMAFVSAVLACEDVKFQPHPGTLKALYDWSFGTGQLTLAHFYPQSKSERDSWNEESRVSLTYFPPHLSAPKAWRPLTSLTDIGDALWTLLGYTSAFSSSMIQSFVGHALVFLNHLRRQQIFSDAHTPIIVQCFDSQFAHLSQLLHAGAAGNARSMALALNLYKTFAVGGASFQDIVNKVTAANWLATAPAPAAPTMRRKLASVGHKRARGDQAGDAVLRGITRPGDQQKRPVSFSVLAAVRAALDLQDDGLRVLWCATVLAFHFLWRRSEYLAINGRVHKNVIALGDICFLDSRDQVARHYEDIVAVQVHIRGSKTDEARRGVLLRIGPSPTAWLCPVAAAWILLRRAHALQLAPKDPLCSLSASAVLTCNDISQAIKRAATACGEDPNEFSTHSLRSGGAAALFRGGEPNLAVQKFGRWSSDAYKSYARIDEQNINALSARMVPNAWRQL